MFWTLGNTIAQKLRTAAVIGLLCAMAILQLPGCSAGTVKKSIERTAQVTEKAIDAKGKLDELIAKADSGIAVADGVLLDAIKAAASLAGVSTRSIDSAIASGKDVVTIAREISAAVGQSAAALLDRLDQLSAELKDAQDSDDATLSTLAWVVGSILPVAAPVLGVITHRLGRKAGAENVVTSIATGRAADPALDQALSNSPAVVRMREKLRALEARVVDRGKRGQA